MPKEEPDFKDTILRQLCEARLRTRAQEGRYDALLAETLRQLEDRVTSLENQFGGSSVVEAPSRGNDAGSIPVRQPMLKNE